MKDLTRGNIYKNFIAFSLPLVLTAILSQSFSMINSMMVGKLLGDNELAYIGSTSSVIDVSNSLIWGFGTGAAIYIGKLFGAKEMSKMVNSIKTSLFMLITLAISISVIGIGFYRPIFSFLKVGEDIYAGAFAYYALVIGGLSIFAFNWGSVYIFNAMGDSSFPFITSTISTVANVLGNALVLAVFGWGVWGTAIVSISVALIVDVIYIFKYTSLFKSVGAEKQKMVFVKADIVSTIKLGIPCLMQQSVMYISGAAVQPLINSISTSAIAAYSICLRLYSLNANIFGNISKCLSYYCTQAIGSNQIDKIKKGIKATVVLACSSSIPLMVVYLLFSREVSGMFFTDVTSKSAVYVQRYILLCVPFFIFQVLNNMFHNFFRGVMAPKIALYTTAFYTIVRVIATTYLVPVWQMDGVYAGFIIAWVLECLLSAIIFVSKKWQSSSEMIV